MILNWLGRPVSLMRLEYSGCHVRFPWYHCVLLCDHILSPAASTPVTKRKSLYREAEGEGSSWGMMFRCSACKLMTSAGLTYKVEVLYPRKFQAKYSAPALNHAVWSTCLSRCPLLWVLSFANSQGWVLTPTIPIGRRLAHHWLLKLFMRPGISAFAAPVRNSLSKYRWTHRNRSSRIIQDDSGINWWNSIGLYSYSLLFERWSSR